VLIRLEKHGVRVWGVVVQGNKLLFSKRGGGGISGIDDYCNRLKKLFCQIFYLVSH